MASDLAVRPLLKWDGFSLRVDLDILELSANRILRERAPSVELLSLEGEDDTLAAHLRLEWKGVPVQVAVRIGEIRLYRRFFGCRLLAVTGPFGLPFPVGIVGALARRVAGGLVHFDADDGVLLVEVRDYVPEGAEIRIQDVICMGRWLEIKLAPGSLAASLTTRLAEPTA